MKHIIGRLAICFAVVSASSLSAVALTMDLADARGRKIDSVTVGVPFQLRVVIKGHYGTGIAPQIECPDDFTCKRSGIQMHTINGDSTTVFTYTSIVSLAKKYTVGPATITINGKTISADPITFEALSSSQSNAHTNTNGQSDNLSKPFMQWIMPKKEVFVGEKMSCAVRFYCPSHIQHLSLKQIQVPHCSDCVLTQKGSQKEGVELIKQKPFKYVEWEFDIQFFKAGSVVVPPFNAEYIIDDDSDQMLFGGFTLFFQHNRLKQVQSDIVSINVKPVPDYKGKPVIAVGQFTRFTALITPTVVRINDAAVLSLRLTGTGNFGMIDHVSLSNLPSSVKIYESESKVESNMHSAEHTKLFDYIMQVSEAGVLKIPSQTLVFFDPEEEKHYVLKTESIEVDVKNSDKQPDDHDTKMSDSQIRETEITFDKDVVDQEGKKVEEFHFMNVIGNPGYTYWEVPLTYHEHIWILLALLCAVCGYFILIRVCEFLYYIVRYRFAYVNARLNLKKIERRNDVKAILNVFKSYAVARHFDVSMHDDSSFLNKVLTILKDKKDKDAWKLFYADVIEATYGALSELRVKDTLWEESYLWLRLLKKKGM